MSKASVSLLVYGIILSFSSFVTAESHLQSKAEFFRQKVPQGHDFTKISNNAKYQPGHLLVRFASKLNGKTRNISEKEHILNALGGSNIKRNYKNTSGLTLVKLPPGQSIEEALKTYNARDDVLYAEPDYEIQLLSTFPNEIDPPGRFNDLWGMHNTSQTGGTSNADIDAPEAWDIITDANDIIVAVIDTGVDYTHPDLAANMWMTDEDPNDANNDGYPGIAGVDDDGDGLIDEDSQGRSRYIDFENKIEDPNWTNDLFEDDDENGYANDIYGYDFSGYDPEDHDSDPIDEHGHGTHVAGTIGSVGNNNLGVVGVCWKTNIMALKIMPPYSGGLNAFISNAIEAIDYSIDNNAKIINASWGIGDNYSQSLEGKIENARDKGILFIAAAGNYPQLPWYNNDYIPVYPASYPLDNIIAVMATDHDDEAAWFSHYGEKSVDLAAPGEHILSCIPGSDYAYASGTSMASPHVAGACALVWAQHPDWNWQMVKSAIMNSVDELDSLTDPEQLCVTRGRLNLHKALTTKPPFLSITKIDDFTDPNYCGVEPEDLITYTIEYANPQEDPNAKDYLGTTYNVEITDYLPPGTYLNLVDPNEDFFDGEVCTWFIDELEPGDSGTITVSVWVNEGAEPSGEIENEVTIESENAFNRVYEYTPVCCWDDTRIIYVDQDAFGDNAGTSWFHAYTNLQSALDRAAKDCGNEIWVADGTYSPGVAFTLIDGVALYGGFGGNETSREQRNWITNQAILTGYGNCEAVVTAEELTFAVLDGFIIEAAEEYGIQCTDSFLHIANCFVHHNGDYGIHCDASDPNITQCTASYNLHGIYCDAADPTITNCLLENNHYGMYCDDSDPNISQSILRDNGIDGLYAKNASAPVLYKCLIEANGSDGIECKDSSSFVMVSNSKIRQNANHGIHCFQADADITNNWIHHNQQNGIKLYSCSSPVTIRNNTIVYNSQEGIDRYSGTAPTIKNNILWGNDSDGSSTQLYNCSATYSCIEGVTVPNSNNNIDDNPQFAYSDPCSYNFHLHTNSPCIDAGEDTDISSGETDIDGDYRITIIDPNVDMGADEVACSDVSNAADFNGDGIVNLFDYTSLAAYWLTDDSDPNWPDQYDLIDDDEINLLDLQVFCNDWLWQACYFSDEWYAMDMVMSPHSNSSGFGFGQYSAMQSMPVSGMQSQATLTAATEPQPIKITEKQLWELIHWLEEIRQTEEYAKEIPEDEWQDFMKRVYLGFDYLE